MYNKKKIYILRSALPVQHNYIDLKRPLKILRFQLPNPFPLTFVNVYEYYFLPPPTCISRAGNHVFKGNNQQWTLTKFGLSFFVEIDTVQSTDDKTKLVYSETRFGFIASIYLALFPEYMLKSISNINFDKFICP